MKKFQSIPTTKQQLRSLKGSALHNLFWAKSLAKEALGKVEGERLVTYMLRRFGLPNAHDDDYKRLAHWVITTPDPNIYLSVSPMLSPYNESSHFAIYYSGKLENEVKKDLEHEKFTKAINRGFVAWWKKNAAKRFAINWWSKEALEARLKNNLSLKLYKSWDGESGSQCLAITSPGVPSNTKVFTDPFVQWEAQNWLKTEAPDLTQPVITEHFVLRPSARQKKMADAIRCALRDLCRPTYVRDHYFNVHGHVADERLEVMGAVDYSPQATAPWWEASKFNRTTRLSP